MPANHHPPKTQRAPRTVEELTARNVKAIAELDHIARASACRSDRIADGISRFCGSVGFVWLHVAWFALWILGNTVLPIPHFDPFPFGLLTLVVSLEAIFLSTFILISGNRQMRLDERRGDLDLQINLLAEQENTKMLQLLEQIANRLHIDTSKDPETAVLEKVTRPSKVLKQIEKTAEEVRQREANGEK
jgi:uncharacterized membrane protein